MRPALAARLPAAVALLSLAPAARAVVHVDDPLTAPTFPGRAC